MVAMNNRVIFLLPVFPEQPRTGGEIYNRQIIDRLKARNPDISVLPLDSLVSLEKLHDASATAEIRRLLKKQLDTISLETSASDQKVTLIYDSWLYRFLWPIIITEHFSGRFRLVSFSQLCYWDTYRSLHSRLWHRLLTFLALAPAHKRIGVSKALLAADLGIFRSTKRDQVIYPGCDYVSKQLRLADCSQMQAQIVSVGNYTPRKGFHILIESMASVFRKSPELRSRLKLKLVGNRSFNPDYLKNLEKMIAENNLQNAIILEDWKTRDEVSAIFSESQLFAFASESEGFGMVVLEAMLHGLPVMLGDFMTARELIGKDGKCGALMAKTSPDDFATAIIQYFSRSDREQMGISARNRATQIGQSWDKAADSFEEIISSE